MWAVPSSLLKPRSDVSCVSVRMVSELVSLKLLATRFVASSVTVFAYSCAVESVVDFDVSYEALTVAPICTGPYFPLTLTPSSTPKLCAAVV